MGKLHGTRWKSIALTDEQRLTAGLVHHRCPAWSADGKWLVFAVGDGAESTWLVCDRRGRVARALEGPADGGASFGPDGALAFGRRSGASGEIWLTPGGAAPAVRLLGGDGRHYREPAFAPDGKSLVFAVSEGRGSSQLGLLDISTGRRRLLAADRKRSDGRPAFCPDGSMLFFEGTSGADGDGQVGVYALELGSEALERATASDRVSRRPAPLSRDLVVVERQDLERRRTQLVLVDRLHGKERPLDDSDAERREPAAFANKRGKVRLTYTALDAGSDGQPGRFDVYVARLRGLTLGDESLPDLIEVPAAAPDDAERAAAEAAADEPGDAPAKAGPG